jgi:stage V sporulation protein K
MKNAKYTLAITLSALSMLLPLAVFLAVLFLSFEKIDLSMFGMVVIPHEKALSVGIPVSAVLLAIGVALQMPLREFRVKARHDVEYDEYGLSKTKGHYEYLSKAERDQIDLQNTASMERLLNTTAIKKMTKQGPPDPMKELDEMIGLEPVKQTIKEMVARMQFEAEENKKKKKKDRVNLALSGRHMAFTGSPGTGKTTVARIMTSFLHQYGYIKENKCIEIDGNFLKAGTESALKTELVLRQAYGGVLFIDEAYALMDSSDNSGEQVIATLIKQMEDQRGKFILIIAGYTKEMKMLIDANPGFESRIKEYLHFPDYNAVEMREIFMYMANKNNFTVDANAFDHYDAIVARERKLKSFGNGRTARNILDKVIDKHTLNLSMGIISAEDRYCLRSQDFQNIKLGTISAGFDRGY